MLLFIRNYKKQGWLLLLFGLSLSCEAAETDSSLRIATLEKAVAFNFAQLKRTKKSSKELNGLLPVKSLMTDLKIAKTGKYFLPKEALQKIFWGVSYFLPFQKVKNKEVIEVKIYKLVKGKVKGKIKEVEGMVANKKNLDKNKIKEGIAAMYIPYNYIQKKDQKHIQDCKKAVTVIRMDKSCIPFAKYAYEISGLAAAKGWFIFTTIFLSLVASGSLGSMGIFFYKKSQKQEIKKEEKALQKEKKENKLKRPA